VAATLERYHQAEQLRMSSRKAVEWRVWCVCLFVCLLYYYWLVRNMYGIGVFADGTSDVLGKWRSGVRQR
jgi:hypothetical protein